MRELTPENAQVTEDQAEMINKVCRLVLAEAGYDPDHEDCEDFAGDVLPLISDLDDELSITIAARSHAGLPIFV